MKTKKTRDDTPRAGYCRWTVIADKTLVEYVREYARKHQIYVADVVTDALREWKKRIGSN